MSQAVEWFRVRKYVEDTGALRKNNAYHNVNKVQNPFIDALNFDFIINLVYVVFALYSSIVLNAPVII
jgi:hypothetical protein